MSARPPARRRPAAGALAGAALRAALRAALLAACGETAIVPRAQVTGGDARRGSATIVAYGCGSCHVIPGVPAAEGRVGPPLIGIADRTFIAGGVLRNEPESLVRWIRDPQAIRPGTAMPDLGVTDPHARDIAAFLYTLGTDALGPPHPIPARKLPGH